MVSIIIPAYNCEEYITDCLLSIQNQIYTDFEAIIVNDGSSDNTFKIAEEFVQNDKRFHVINQENSGVSNARNKGLLAASGEYISFVDSDDIVHPDFLSLLVDALEKYDADISSCSSAYVLNNKIIKEEYGTGNTYIYNREEGIKQFFLGGKINIAIWTKLFKRHIVEGIMFDENIRINEDKMFLFKAMYNCQKIVVVDVSKYDYMQRETSVTHMSFNDKWFDTIKVSKMIIECICEKKLMDFAFLDLIKTHYWTLLNFYKNREAIHKYENQFRDTVYFLKKVNLLKYSKYLSRNMIIQILILKVSENLLRKIKRTN